VEVGLRESVDENDLFIGGEEPVVVAVLEARDFLFRVAFPQSILALFLGLFFSSAQADELAGDWSLTLQSGTPGWLSLKKVEGKTVVKMRLHVGSEGPHEVIKEEGGRLSFNLRRNKKGKGSRIVDLGMKDGKLEGVVVSTSKDGVLVNATPKTDFSATGA